MQKDSRNKVEGTNINTDQELLHQQMFVPQTNAVRDSESQGFQIFSAWGDHYPLMRTVVSSRESEIAITA